MMMHMAALAEILTENTLQVHNDILDTSQDKLLVRYGRAMRVASFCTINFTPVIAVTGIDGIVAYPVSQLSENDSTTLKSYQEVETKRRIIRQSSYKEI